MVVGASRVRETLPLEISARGTSSYTFRSGGSLHDVPVSCSTHVGLGKVFGLILPFSRGNLSMRADRGGLISMMYSRKKLDLVSTDGYSTCFNPQFEGKRCHQRTYVLVG